MPFNIAMKYAHPVLTFMVFAGEETQIVPDAKDLYLPNLDFAIVILVEHFTIVIAVMNTLPP